MKEQEKLYGYLLVSDVELAELIAGRVPERVIGRAVALADDLIERLKENARRAKATR